MYSRNHNPNVSLSVEKISRLKSLLLKVLHLPFLLTGVVVREVVLRIQYLEAFEGVLWCCWEAPGEVL